MVFEIVTCAEELVRISALAAFIGSVGVYLALTRAERDVKRWKTLVEN